MEFVLVGANLHLVLESVGDIHVIIAFKEISLFGVEALACLLVLSGIFRFFGNWKLLEVAIEKFTHWRFNGFEIFGFKLFFKNSVINIPLVPFVPN